MDQMSSFEVGNIRVDSGNTVRGSIGVITMPDSTQVQIPAVVVNGIEDGPTLLALGSVHGIELVGTGVLTKVVRGLDPLGLRGRLIAVPMANPLAQVAGTYITPWDHTNLSGPIYWPADEQGSITHRIAGFITDALKRSTHLVDIHANPDLSINFVLMNPRVSKDAETRATAIRMAQAWGTTTIDWDRDNVHHLTDIALAHGIPAIIPELQRGRQLLEDNVQVGVVGLTNVMKVLGMLEGELAPQSVERYEGSWVAAGRLTANRSGLLWIRRRPGEFLPKDELVATVTDIWGDVVEEIRMPFDGYCWALSGGVGTDNHHVFEGTQIAFVYRKRG